MLDAEVPSFRTEMTRQGVGTGELLTAAPFGDTIPQVTLTLKIFLPAMEILMPFSIVRTSKCLRAELTLVRALSRMGFHVRFQVVRFLKHFSTHLTIVGTICVARQMRLAQFV